MAFVASDICKISSINGTQKALSFDTAFDPATVGHLVRLYNLCNSLLAFITTRTEVELRSAGLNPLYVRKMQGQIRLRVSGEGRTWLLFVWEGSEGGREGSVEERANPNHNPVQTDKRGGGSIISEAFDDAENGVGLQTCNATALR